MGPYSHHFSLVCAAPAGARTLSGSLLQSGAANLAGLDSLRSFTPPAQLALLQQLTAKGTPADSRWLQASPPSYTPGLDVSCYLVAVHTNCCHIMNISVAMVLTKTIEKSPQVSATPRAIRGALTHTVPLVIMLCISFKVIALIHLDDTALLPLAALGCKR